MKIELTKRPILYQWDWDRFVRVALEGDEKVDELHFVNRRVLNEALPMKANANENGDILVEVPRQLLVEPGTLYVYPVIYSENGEQTLDVKPFVIFEREKPTDYVHGETEVLSYRKLSKEMLEQIKKLEEKVSKLSEEKADKSERIEKTTDDTVVEIEPNKLYVFPEMTALSYTLVSKDASKAEEYHFVFQSGETPTELTHPDGVKIGDFKVEANKIYEVSILENLLLSQSWVVE